MSVRADETTAVVSMLREGQTVEVRGAEGSGRSALLREVVERLEQAGVATLAVSGRRALRGHPFEALSLAGVRPDDGGCAGSGSAASEVTRWVAALAARLISRQAVLIVDDAAEIDIESWAVIAAARRRTGLPIVYALDTGGPHGPGAVRALDGDVRVVTLHPLRYEEVRTLIERTLDAPVDADAAGRIFSKSAGRPGLVVALARVGRERGLLEVRDGAWRAGSDLWHPDLTPHIGEILAPLAPPLRDGLEVLAFAGTIPIDAAAEMVEPEVLERLEELGLVTAFDHGARELVAVDPPIIVEYYRHQGVSVRRHRLMARVRDGHGRVAPTRGRGEWAAVRAPAVTRLLLEGRRACDGRAAESWRLAPSLETGVALLDALAARPGSRAAATMPGSGSGSGSGGGGGDADRYGDLCDALDYDPGQPHASLGLLAHRLARWHPHGEADADASPQRDPFGDETRRAVAALPALADAVRVIVAEAEMRAASAAGRRSPTALPHAPGRIDTSVVEAVVAAAEMHTASGRFDAALTLLESGAEQRAEQRAERRAELAPSSTGRGGVDAPSPHWERRRRRVWALALFGAGRMTEALARSSDWRELALAELDADALRDQAYVSALALVHTGRNVDADDAIGAALALGMPGPVDAPVYGAMLVLGAIVASRRGLDDVARSLAAQARAHLTIPGPLPLAAPAFAEAQRLRADGDDARCRRVLIDAQEDFLRSGFRVQAAVAEVMALEVPAGDGPLVPRSSPVDGDLFGPLLDYLRGVSRADASWIEDAGDRLRAAGQTVHAAGAYLRAADAYRAAGRADDVARMNERAHALGGELDPDVLWHIHAQAAARPQLTIREREIAALAAAGEANTAIADALTLSVRTVENHLSHAFRKLGITRRDELEGVRSLWDDGPG